MLFDDQAYRAKPFSELGATDMDAIGGHIENIQSARGTNMESGYTLGVKQFQELQNTDLTEYENRIIFLTDAIPNSGDTSRQGLVELVEEQSEKGIYSSFIGIGLDFNSNLIESMTKIKGVNYSCVKLVSVLKKNYFPR